MMLNVLNSDFETSRGPNHPLGTSKMPINRDFMHLTTYLLKKGHADVTCKGPGKLGKCYVVSKNGKW